MSLFSKFLFSDLFIGLKNLYCDRSQLSEHSQSFYARFRPCLSKAICRNNVADVSKHITGVCICRTTYRDVSSLYFGNHI